MGKYLKSRNIPRMSLFIIWCFAIYAVAFSCNGPSWNSLALRFSDLNRQDGLIILVMPLLILVLSSVIKPQLKEKLVFWRWHNTLPGCRVFTELAPADSRIDMTLLKEKITELPNEPEKQNALWYRLFRKYHESVSVLNPHRDFLLARDLSIIALLMAFAGTAGLAIRQVKLTNVILYFVIMVLHYFALAVVTQNLGNRLACNVLTECINDN